MSEKQYKLEDAKSERVVFKGTERECLEYTKQDPDRKYIMVEIKKTVK